MTQLQGACQPQTFEDDQPLCYAKSKTSRKMEGVEASNVINVPKCNKGPKCNNFRS